MKATVMVNDWVMFKGLYYQVTEISRKGWVHLSYDGTIVSMSSDYLLEELQPVPITPEILGRNGFKPTQHGYVIAEDYYDITIREWSDSIWVFRYESTEMNIPHTQIVFGFVHELQHALRLCGLDEMADNFKVQEED